MKSKTNPEPFPLGPDWQDVPDDAILPPGAHITFNMTTGQKQARMPPEQPEAEPKPDPDGPYDEEYTKQQPVLPGSRLDWGSLAGLKPPPREFIVPDWIPACCVTLLHGFGGVGKSLVAQQIGTAAAFKTHLLGGVANACPVLGWWGEDDHDELWRRQLAINAMLGIPGDLGAVAGKLHWRACPGDDITLFEATSEGAYQTTPAYDLLREEIGDTKSKLAILDSAAQIAAIPEGNRPLVTRALGVLHSLCVELKTTIVLIGHNNREGDYSGSSAWENRARSRIHMKREKDPETAEEVIKLCRPKANYAAELDDGVALEWHKGAYRFTDPRVESFGDQLERQMRERAAAAAFLAALDQLTERKITTSVARQARNYAPKAIVENDLAGDFKPHELQKALRRLLAEGTLSGDVTLWQKGNRHWASGLGRTTPPAAAEELVGAVV